MVKNKNLQQGPKKGPANEPKQVILQTIEVRKWMRTEQDIPKWRNAIKSAEAINPRRKLLYNLYADVALDGHVESVTGKRKDAVTAANWQFVDQEGKPIDEVNALIDTIGFDDLLNAIIDSRFWGYSILEPKFWKGIDDTWEMSAGLIPRLHYRPELGVVTFDAVGDDGINIREGIYAKTVIEVGNVNDLGLYMKAAPYQILKRGGMGDYAAFIQTYGNPLIDATWDGFDNKQKEQLQAALTGLGAGGNIIRPEGTNIEIKENNAKNTGDAHGSFLSFLNKEISKALLGSTETTESSVSSGYAQSKTHAEEDDSKHDNDITYARKVLNSRLIRVLQSYGFNTMGGKFIVQGEETELSKAESFAIHSQLATTHKLPVEDDFWYETYGVPKPDNYEQLKKEMEEKGNAPETKPVQGGGRKKGGKGNKEEEEEEVKLSFLQRLASFFVKAPAVTTGAEPTACSHHRITLAESDAINNDALLHRIYDAKGKLSFDSELFWKTTNILNQGFKKGWDTGKEITLSDNPSFIYGEDDPAMLTHFERSIFRFAGQKNIKILQKLNQLYRQSKSFEEFYVKAGALIEVSNKDWLETEYTTATLTGEAAATYHRLKAQKDIFPYWEYKTVGDNLVRASHVPLHGLVLPADDKRWDKIFPPNGWNCRCYVVPRMRHEVDKSKFAENRKKADAYLNGPRGQKDFAAGWGTNRVKDGEVFTEVQQYSNKFNSLALKELNQLQPVDFKLPLYNDAKKEASATWQDYKGDAKAYYSALEEIEGKKTVRDYSNRPLVLSEKDWRKHSTDQKKNRAHRVTFLTGMQEALNKPDEVWLNGNKLDQLVYIKYFKGKTILNVAHVKNNAVHLKSWFLLADSEVPKYRKGLLVNKKPSK